MPRMVEWWKLTLHLISKAVLLPVQITAHKHSKHLSITVLQNALLKLVITCKEKIAIWFRNELLISYTILTEILGKCAVSYTGVQK